MTVVHLYMTVGHQESRFWRESRALRSAAGLDSVIVYYWKRGYALHEQLSEGIEVRRIKLRSASLGGHALALALKSTEWCCRVLWMFRSSELAAVQCHGVRALPVAWLLSKLRGAPLVYDCHELETERAGLHGVHQKLDRFVERALIRRCDAVVCVNDSIADWYRAHYRIERPVVVRNLPDLHTQKPSENSLVLRKRFEIPDGHVLFLYQGSLSPGRRVEQYLRVFRTIDRTRHVVFMGYGELQSEILEAAAACSNIHFLDAVAPDEVLRYSSSADVGLVGMEHTCLSYYFSLPNKFFEYLCADIPVLSGRLPEIAAIVEHHQCGWLHDDDDDSLRTVIEGLDRSNIDSRKRGCRGVRDAFSWDHEASKFNAIYLGLGASSVAKTS